MKQRKGDPRDRVTIKPRSPRKRLLNVIYFIDSKRTRTLQISLKTAGLSVGVLAVMLIWSLVASGLLVNELLVNNSLREHTRKLLTNIFNYQTRYDNVYERAYPDQTSSTSLATNEKTNKDSDTIKVEETSKPETAEEAQEDELNEDSDNVLALSAKDSIEAPTKQNVISKSTEKEKNSGAPPIAIENFSSALNDQLLTVRFSLKNLEKKKKTTGTVNARALYIDENRKIRFIRMRIENDTNEANSDNDSPSSDQHFNIRYYKNKVFHFDKPSDAAGAFTEVIIAIEDELGRMKEFTYKINTTSINESQKETKQAEKTEPSTTEETTPPYAAVTEPEVQPQAQ